MRATTHKRGTRERAKKVVAVFGVFDILHPGHLAFLEAAKRRGDELVVVVTPDEKVRKEKGRRPSQPLKDRLRVLRALKVVDRAVPGDGGKRWTTVERLRPDVICVGYDQDATHPAFLAQLERLPEHPKVVRLRPTAPSRYGSSRIISR